LDNKLLRDPVGSPFINKYVKWQKLQNLLRNNSMLLENSVRAMKRDERKVNGSNFAFIFRNLQSDKSHKKNK